MTSRVLIIGAYGNFGSFITKSLAKETNIQLILAGRSLQKAKKLATNINADNPVESIALDITLNLESALKQIKPDLIIHTSGPFQSQGYDVAKTCITLGIHYIDLADGRDFVNDITQLHEQAKENNALVISGASSVPCLTAALIDHYKSKFQTIESVDYGITTAQKTTRGLATTAAILGYTGKKFSTLVDGKETTIYGWQSLHGRRYKQLGWRLLANCNTPDLALFPKRYPEIKTIRFYAGLEISFIHITLWSLSWLVRFGLIKNLQPAAAFLLRTSFLFDWLGSANSGFHMTLQGKDHQSEEKTITFELTARSGDGPYIPCMPAILLAKRIADKQLTITGAYPCVDFINRDDYLNALKGLDIDWIEF